ncbi:MAG TPA: hypothetical protein VLI39_12645 [Sedimentisphaerales bacterium]|nr:hypothetical protein [Sedimentisphaerales bacterium]
MKSTFNLVSVYAIAMLLLSNAAFGVILSSGYSCDGSGFGDAGWYPGEESSSVAATSDSSYTSSSAWAGGVDGYYTTVDANCSWSAYLYVWAGAAVIMADGSPTAEGSAGAYADLPSNWRSFSLYASAWDGSGVQDEDYDSLSVGDTGYFAAGTGVDCSHSVYCSTHASGYGSNEAVAWAVATADASM